MAGIFHCFQTAFGRREAYWNTGVGLGGKRPSENALRFFRRPQAFSNRLMTG
ncbi:hypothetical protein NEIELOOT_00897 [Neisseria elongata subsp. glycolytica ATCC 29315]|uniref:Uncharacterized protein n=1 Tax=Neisseria elongata subsp. glycolytica ATCC 29315 TaxID=546263 RepID=D4DPB2_NEIEG|nr:hypothetical protein [Neisseria elongata]EFE50220.1 hypothetical protein NEIELOOT_00897 [Neisseria elongata subsp. glycolytica ATCC 29315]